MLSLNIPEELRRDLEELASRQGVALDHLIEKALQDLVRTEKAETPAVIATAAKSTPARWVEIPGAYRFSPSEIEAELAEIFTPEELAEIAKTDLSNLPPGTKTVTEILSEDREDRF
jgi:predicted transcriptional regulator